MDAISTRDGVQQAAAIFQALNGERAAEKTRAIEQACAAHGTVDRPTLRTLLLKAIAGDFAAGKEDDHDDPSIAARRSWMVGLLARLSLGDEAATEAAVSHVGRAVEPYRWARYWALEGLIWCRNPRAEQAAHAAAKDVEDPLVSLLASAWLGSLGDRKALRKVKAALEDSETTWFALRALRIVPLQTTVPVLCKIVSDGAYSDDTYDAIMALGMVPAEWSHHATAAAQALSGSIVGMRGDPWKDGMRTGAITGLANLREESSAPLLIEELADDNPAIVREAARGIEKILGLSVAVTRVVEAAARADESGVVAYGRALRWLPREDAAEVLDTLMFNGSARQQDTARALLSELGGTVAFQKLRARTDVMKQYSDVLEKAEEKIRALFETSVREAQNGFHLAVIMDMLVFGVGLLLLLGSAAYALFMKGDLANWAGAAATGGTGVLGIVYGVLIANPRRQVRESVDHLMRVKMVFLAYLRRLHQADQAYARRMLDDAPITMADVKGFSDTVGLIMMETLGQSLDGGPVKSGGLARPVVGHTDGAGRHGKTAPVSDTTPVP